jgi:hypothetical protein
VVALAATRLRNQAGNPGEICIAMHKMSGISLSERRNEFSE